MFQGNSGKLLYLQYIATTASGCIELRILLREIWIIIITYIITIITMVNQGEGLDPRFMETRDCVTSYALSKVAKLYGMSEHGVQEWLKSKKPIIEHIGKYQGQMSKSQLQSIQCDEPQPQQAQPKSKVKIRRYDIYLKYEAVMDYERINSVDIVSKKHGLSKTVLYKWLRNARRIKETFLSRTGQSPEPSSSKEQSPQCPNTAGQSFTCPMPTEPSSMYREIKKQSPIHPNITEQSSIYSMSIYPLSMEQSSIHPNMTEQSVDSTDRMYQDHDTQSLIGNYMFNCYRSFKLINQHFILICIYSAQLLYFMLTL